MSADREARASALFLALADVLPADRDAWLDAHCGNDPELRREIESMLGALDAPGDFLDPDAIHPRAVDGDTPLTPGTRLGAFTIERVIGAGSAGIVYLARQQHPQRNVALKVLRRGLAASSARRRFEIEAELLGRLHHPGIASIFAAHPGDHAAPPFIAMELVDGPPITEFVAGNQIDLRGRLELMARICDAVQHAHQRGIIHRDLKPANVLVTSEGEPKILDFGVARSSGHALALSTITTEAGQLLGTVPFMSPEQIAALPDEIDTRTDIYALGVILFRILTGRLPFADDNPPLPELARRIVQVDPPRLGTIDASYSGDLEIVVATALAKEKERRYASAGDFAADLRRVLSGQPVAASAASAWYFVMRRLRRYRWAVAVSAAGFVALTGLAIYASLERMRAEDTSARLSDELATSTIERARLLGRSGNLPAAENLLWPELFRNPSSSHARWSLWELYAEQPSLWTRAMLPRGVNLVKFSADGKHLLAAAGDTQIRILDATTGATLHVLDGHTGTVTDLALFPGTSSFASAADDGTIRVWDTDGRSVGAFDTNGTAIVQIAPMSPDRVVALTTGGGVRILRLEGGRTSTVHDLGDLDAARVAAFAASNRFAVGTQQGEIILWDANRPRILWSTAVHRGTVSALAFHPHMNTLVTGGADGLVIVIDASTGRDLQRLSPSNGTIRNLAFDRRGNRLASAGWWRSVLWTVEDGRLGEEQTVSQPSAWTAIDPGGRFLATSDGYAQPGQSVPSGVRLWDLDADSRIVHWSAGSSRIVGLSAIDDARFVLTASADGTLLGRRATGNDATFTTTIGGNPVNIVVGSDARHAFTIDGAGRIVAWDARSGERRAETPTAASEAGRPLRSSAFGMSSDGSLLMAGDAAGGVTLWQLAEGHFERKAYYESNDGEVLSVAERNGFIAVAHRPGTVTIRERSSGRIVARLQQSAAPFSLAFTPDGRWLAVGTWAGDVELWATGDWRRIRTFSGHSRLTSSLDFSTDGSLLISASRDGTVRLWETHTGLSLATLTTRAVGASRVRMVSNDRVLVGYDDGEVEIRDLTYYFRHVAGQAEWQLLQLADGSSYPRAAEVLEWARSVSR